MEVVFRIILLGIGVLLMFSSVFFYKEARDSDDGEIYFLAGMLLIFALATIGYGWNN